MKGNREVWRNLALVTQIGITMLTPIFLMTFLGVWVDKTFSTNFFLIFVVLGVGGGFRSVYTIVMQQNKKEEKKENEQNKKFE